MTAIRLEYKGGGKLVYSWKVSRITLDKSKGVVSLPEWWHSFLINSVETQGKEKKSIKNKQTNKRTKKNEGHAGSDFHEVEHMLKSSL